VIDCLALVLLQLELRRGRVRLHLRTQVARLVAVSVAARFSISSASERTADISSTSRSRPSSVCSVMVDSPCFDLRAGFSARRQPVPIISFDPCIIPASHRIREGPPWPSFPRSTPNRSGEAYVDLSRAFRSRMGDRSKRRLGDACGLTRFGVNLVTLGPAGIGAPDTGIRSRTSSSTC
jgi:hypothetical protein